MIPALSRFLLPSALLSLGFSAAMAAAALGPAPKDDNDPLKAMQAEAIASKAEPRERPYHFGSQGQGNEFSNHTSHTNRLVPVFTLGKTVDLKSITGANSSYRNAERLRELYGQLPQHTLDPDAEYGDQADLYRLQKEAVERGAKQLFVVLFDGLDWETLNAAAIVKSGDPNAGAALLAGELGPAYQADGSLAVGAVVTSPTHSGAKLDVDRQSVAFPDNVLRGGYDPRFAGRGPLQVPELDAPGYLRGQSATPSELAQIHDHGGVPHAYTDSSCSAAEIAAGVKSYNSSVNVAPDGSFMTPLFHDLQRDGWKVGTVTSVPISHASPAAFYARNVSRDDYQDLTRDMLGLPSIATERGAPEVPGLDVVIGTGFGQTGNLQALQRRQGSNAVAGNVYLTDDDLAAIDTQHGGPYVVAQRTEGANGNDVLNAAAERAAAQGHRLFGFFGTEYGHLPYQTANGGYDPAPGISGEAEQYASADIAENPTLTEMTQAALTVLGQDPDQPFALFVEAGDVDWALHDNNLDAAIGAVFSGEEAIRAIIDWVEQHSSWDDAAVIITADHGHYLVINDPEALAGANR
ncbi:alkaline phosphatase [Tautonia marina]|uniref:alkaline phosphatase n=1 Tax=Tautonia marina TaxID=2653855 RepID=UPI001260D61C|nr:alkaline phosphatase [Tautonia marina]